MEFIGKPINNCYLLQENLGENEIFSTWRAKAMYSPNNFSISFFNFLLNDPPKSVLQNFEDLFFRIYNFDNSYILAPFEYSTYEHTRFIASNWIEGYSLRQVMDKGLIASFDQVVNIIIFLLRGLSSLEKAGIHHNSLSPRAIVVPDANIEYGRIKLRNIGVSLFVDAFPEGRYVQKIKPYYLPAQQYPDGPQRDLYATAVITLELLQLVRENDGNPEQKATIMEIARKVSGDPGTFLSIDEMLNTIIEIHPEKELIDHLNEHAQARLEAQDYSDILKRIRRGETISSEADYNPPEASQHLNRTSPKVPRPAPSPDGDFFPEGVSPPPEREGFISRVVSAFQRLISGGRRKKGGKVKKGEGFGSSDEPELLIPLEEELEIAESVIPEPETEDTAENTQAITGSLHEPDRDSEARRNRVAAVLRKLQDHFNGFTRRMSSSKSSSTADEAEQTPRLPIDADRNISRQPGSTPLSENNSPTGKAGFKDYDRNINNENTRIIPGKDDRDSRRHPGFAPREPRTGEEYSFGEGTPDLTGEFLELEGDGGLGEGSEYEKARINTDRENPEEHDPDSDHQITGDLHNRAEKKQPLRDLSRKTEMSKPAPSGMEENESTVESAQDRHFNRKSNSEERTPAGFKGNADNAGEDEEQPLKDSILPPPAGNIRANFSDPTGKQGFFARLKRFVQRLFRRINDTFRR